MKVNIFVVIALVAAVGLGAYWLGARKSCADAEASLAEFKDRLDYLTGECADQRATVERILEKYPISKEEEHK